MFLHSIIVALFPSIFSRVMNLFLLQSTVLRGISALNLFCMDFALLPHRTDIHPARPSHLIRYMYLSLGCFPLFWPPRLTSSQDLPTDCLEALAKFKKEIINSHLYTLIKAIARTRAQYDSADCENKLACERAPSEYGKKIQREKRAEEGKS